MESPEKQECSLIPRSAGLKPARSYLHPWVAARGEQGLFTRVWMKEAGAWRPDAKPVPTLCCCLVPMKVKVSRANPCLLPAPVQWPLYLFPMQVGAWALGAQQPQDEQLLLGGGKWLLSVTWGGKRRGSRSRGSGRG